MFDRLNENTRLIQEHEVIQKNVSRISELSRELVNLAGLQTTYQDLTSEQISYLNEKRINLRHNVVNLKDGLQLHFNMEEEVMRHSISRSLFQKMTLQHIRVLKKLSEFDGVILNLSPIGTLFNSQYLKRIIDTICLIVDELIRQENRLLEFADIGRVKLAASIS